MKKIIIKLSYTTAFLLILGSCSKNSHLKTLKDDLPRTPTSFSSNGVGSGSTFFDLRDSRDLITPFDYYGTGHATELVCYRPGKGICWILKNTKPVGEKPNFVPIYQSSNGIGSGSSYFALDDSRDKVFAYDFERTGKLNYLVCYRPGMGAFWIFKMVNGVFNIILSSSNGVGFGSTFYDLRDSRDLIVPFDFYNTGHATQLLCYRPGMGTCWILSNTAPLNATPRFTPIYRTSSGIGKPPEYFALNDSRDLIYPYDLKGLGSRDHLICYRPGTGEYYCFDNDPIYGFRVHFPWGISHYGVVSLGGQNPGAYFDLNSSNDRVIPFDYYGISGNALPQGVIAYRLGAGACYIFTSWQAGGCGYLNNSGIGSGSTYYFFNDPRDKVIPYDIDGTGKVDHLVCYRPGMGACWIFKHNIVTGSIDNWEQIY